MRTDVPVYLFAVIDTAGFDKQFEVEPERAISVEVVGDIRAGELLEDFGAV